MQSTRALAAVMAVAVGAASPRPAYTTVLEMYRRGDTHAAIAAIDQFRPAEIDREIKNLIDAENARVRREGGARIWLQTAAVAQLEYSLARGETAFTRGIRTGDRFGVVGPASGGPQGRDQSWRAVTPLYDPPRGRRTEGAGTDAAFLTAWFRYNAVHVTARGRWSFARQVIDEGLRQIGDDPELLLALGALHELAWRTEHDEEQPANEFRGDLAAAETAFARATALDATLDEARLRLGRVQAKRGEFQAAIDTLAPLKAPRTEPGFVYLARLFSGEAFEGLRDFPKAEEAYTGAIAAMPSAESAQIALAQLLHLTGRRDDALRRVTTLATGADSRATDDPWLLYRAGVAWRDQNYLDALRALVRR